MVHHLTLFSDVSWLRVSSPTSFGSRGRRSSVRASRATERSADSRVGGSHHWIETAAPPPPWMQNRRDLETGQVEREVTVAAFWKAPPLGLHAVDER